MQENEHPAGGWMFDKPTGNLKMIPAGQGNRLPRDSKIAGCGRRVVARLMNHLGGTDKSQEKTKPSGRKKKTERSHMGYFEKLFRMPPSHWE